MGSGFFALAMVFVGTRLYPTGSKDTKSSAEGTAFVYCFFVVPQVSAGAVRLFGADALITARVAVLSTLPMAVILVILALWHQRERNELLILAGICTAIGLGFGVPLLSADTINVRRTSW